MEHGSKQEPKVDERIATYLENQGQRVGRRGMLTTVGRMLLRLSGLTLIPLLPLDRRFTVSAASTCSWETCGMCGTFCSSCCGSSGGFSTCPNCLTKGGAWGLCCYNTALGVCSCDKGYMFFYYDCCGTPTNAAACRSTTSCGTPPTGNCAGYGGGVYCTNGYTYGCTIVSGPGAACNACNNKVQPPSE